MCGAAYVILFGGALIGDEVLLTEDRELVKIVNSGKLDTSASHVVVPLVGRFKGEEGEINVLLALDNITVMSDLIIR